MTDRLDDLINGALESGFTIDYLEALTAGLSSQARRKVIGNASALPKYMKSSDNPYVWRNAIAPSVKRCSDRFHCLHSCTKMRTSHLPPWASVEGVPSGLPSTATCPMQPITFLQLTQLPHA